MTTGLDVAAGLFRPALLHSSGIAPPSSTMVSWRRSSYQSLDVLSSVAVHPGGSRSVTDDLDIRHPLVAPAWRVVFLGGAFIHRLHAVTGDVDIRKTESKEADMRKLVLTVVALLSLASVSYAQTSGKIATVWKCAGGTR